MLCPRTYGSPKTEKYSNSTRNMNEKYRDNEHQIYVENPPVKREKPRAKPKNKFTKKKIANLQKFKVSSA